MPIAANPLSPVYQMTQSLRRNLLRLGRLRFDGALEADFQAHLRSSQQRTALFTLVVATITWMLFTLLDLWRMHSLEGTAQAETLLWGSLVWRWPVLVCFLGAFYTMRHARTQGLRYDASVAVCLLASSIAIPLSSYTLKNLGMTETSVVLVVLISLAFFPLGIRLRVMAPVAIAIAAIITVIGPLMLHTPAHIRAHWVLSAVVWVTLILSGVAAYYRECGLREQYVLRQLLHWETLHDPLTGLSNRRMYNEHISSCMRQAQREQVPLYLVILDLDHFKFYNDHYGHSAGDEVLRKIAGLLQEFAQRPLDLATRLGGEEFGLVVYGMPPSQIEVYLQEFMDTLHNLQLEHVKSPISPYVTLSMGAAWVNANDTPDSLFQRADALLYHAKHNGRNRAYVQVKAASGSELPDDSHLRTVLPTHCMLTMQSTTTSAANL